MDALKLREYEAPDWSVRVSFANLDDDVYDEIGRALRAVGRSYRQACEASDEGRTKAKAAKTAKKHKTRAGR